MHYQTDYAEFRSTIRSFAEREIQPIATQIEEEDRLPMERLLPVFGELGLLQMLIPEAYGGPGCDLTMACIAKEEISRFSPAAALLPSQNSAGAVLPLLHIGSEEQKRKFLPEFAKGRLVTALAITEPHCGSDVRAMKTRAIRDGDSYVLNGSKCFITMGSHADYILVMAKTDDTGGHDGISAFLVNTKTRGFKIGKKERTMGLKGVPSVELFFDNVRVPADHLIGEEGKAFKPVMRVLNFNRPGIAAIALGIAQAALDASIEFSKNRKAFGQTVSSFQGIRFMLADMALNVEAGRALLYSSLSELRSEAGRDLAYTTSLVKCFLSDMATKVTSDAMQVFGGAGYIKDYPVERMFRDAKVTQVWEGTNQIQRVIISRHLVT